MMELVGRPDRERKLAGADTRVLIVDDDRSLANNVRTSLEEYGFSTEVVCDGDSALTSLAAARFDLVILDVRLGAGPDGFEVCRELRDRGAGVAVLMLTALDSLADRARGLEVGADDHLGKPFTMRELLARVRTLTGGTAPAARAVVRFDDMVLDIRTRAVSVGGRAVPLTEKELALMELLMEREGASVSADALSARLWRASPEAASDLVGVYVARLRRRLAAASSGVTVEALPAGRYRLRRGPSRADAMAADAGAIEP